MKKINHDQLGLAMLRAIDGFSQHLDLSLIAPARLDELLEVIRASIQSARDSGTIVHGLRVETMFAYVASALGGCDVIKQEDAGDLYASSGALAAPDYRVMLRDGAEILIEVKNDHAAINDDTRYTFSKEYFTKLTNYAQLFRRDLFIAIFWSRMRQWTLVPAAAFSRSEAYSLPLRDCMMLNEMFRLGDVLVGIESPLTIRAVLASVDPPEFIPNRSFTATVDRFELHVAGQRIDDPVEQRLATFLIWNAGWHETHEPADVRDGRVVAVEFRFICQPSGDQNFAIVGALSEMASRQYNRLTAPRKQVERLVPREDPIQFDRLIPKDYKGKVLRLWQFSLRPAVDNSAPDPRQAIET